MSPVFFMFNDRERVLRHHRGDHAARACIQPGFASAALRRICPTAGKSMVARFLEYLPPRLNEYDTDRHAKSDFQGAHAGHRRLSPLNEAIEWGVTGADLRAADSNGISASRSPTPDTTSLNSNSDGSNGDCYDRAAVRIEEMRQSLRIIEQCVKNMPAGPYKSDHPLATPPREGPHHARHRNLDHAFLERELGAGVARRAKRSARSRPPRAITAITW